MCSANVQKTVTSAASIQCIKTPCYTQIIDKSVSSSGKSFFGSCTLYEQKFIAWYESHLFLKKTNYLAMKCTAKLPCMKEEGWPDEYPYIIVILRCLVPKSSEGTRKERN